MTKKKLEIDGYTYYYSVNYCDNKEADPILFINGSFQSMSSWQKVVGKLEGRATTIIADLPGWGEADYLPEHIDFDIYANAIQQIIEAESIPKINIFSSSFGTSVAISFARKYPSHVSNLVLSSPILEIDSTYRELFEEMMCVVKGGCNTKLADYLVSVGLMNDHEGLKGSIPQYNIIKKIFHRQLTQATEDTLAKFICNAQRIINEGSISLSGIGHINMLSFTGEYDEFTTPKNCLKTTLEFTQGHFTTIKNADHLFVNEQLEVTCALMTKFFFNKSMEYVEGCTNIFSMQNANASSKKILKQYENVVKKSLSEAIEIPLESTRHPWMLQASSYTL